MEPAQNPGCLTPGPALPTTPFKALVHDRPAVLSHMEELQLEVFSLTIFPQVSECTDRLHNNG